MLRAFSLALTLIFAAPAMAVTDDTPVRTVVAQQKPAPPMPKRDCERNADGIS